MQNQDGKTRSDVYIMLPNVCTTSGMHGAETADVIVGHAHSTCSHPAFSVCMTNQEWVWLVLVQELQW